MREQTPRSPQHLSEEERLKGNLQSRAGFTESSDGVYHGRGNDWASVQG